MKLTEMNLDLASHLMYWWVETSTTRYDALKDPDVLFNTMFNDGGKSNFYLIPGLLFIVTDVIPGAVGTIYEAGLLTDKYNKAEAKQELISIVREYSLNRLSYMSPSPVTALSSALKNIGFKYEGRLKYSCIYNGLLADMDLYGFYSVMPEKARRRRGRRRDARKENALANRPSDFTVKQNGLHREEEGGRSSAGRNALGGAGNAGSDQTVNRPEGNSRHDSHGEFVQSASQI